MLLPAILPPRHKRAEDLRIRQRPRPLPFACISASHHPSPPDNPRADNQPDRGGQGCNLSMLPITEIRKGRRRQYVMEGEEVKTIELDDLDTVVQDVCEVVKQRTLLHKLQRVPKRFQEEMKRIEDSFFPDPALVTADYWAYSRWRFVQRIASSAISVLATQQMLYAVGLGSQRALPTAAVLNWVLKDGLGRLGKLTVATGFGRQFDADLKRFRFTSSVVYDMAAAVEIMTPLFPKQFLALATLANVGKSVGITTANVCRAPIQRSFAKGENLADIAARTSAQQVMADNLGLALMVAVTAAVRNRARARAVMPFVLFPLLAITDLVCIHKELKNVQLRTLNKERGEILANHYIATGAAPSFASVAAQEHLFIPASLDEGTLPLSILPLSEVAASREQLRAALATAARVRGGDPGRYVLTYKHAADRSAGPLRDRLRTWMSRLLLGKTTRKRSKLKGCATLALQKDADVQDLLTVLLQVAHLRHLPFRPDLTVDEARHWAMEESLTRAIRDYPSFLESVQAEGWQTHQVLLSSAERTNFHCPSGLRAVNQLLNPPSPPPEFCTTDCPSTHPPSSAPASSTSGEDQPK